MPNVSEIDDVALAAHVRARVTPEMVEYIRRMIGKFRPDQAQSVSGSQFNYLLGFNDGKRSAMEAFQQLLNEATNPENL